MQGKKIHYYYVDEAGDLTIFDRKGRIVVGNEGVSNYFMVGVANIMDPPKANEELERLRTELLNDPYFRGVPSMQKNAQKTALTFHAKNDLQEVRREVFKLLQKIETKVQVVIRRKQVIADIASRSYRYTGKKFDTNSVYDDLIKRLFKNMLHKADENKIYYARRGNKKREGAFYNAIEKAKLNFERKWQISVDKPISIMACYPDESIGLQIIDYYLWALQRLYERREERFFNLLRKNYRLIMDIDDKRNKEYGEWYSDRNPLTIGKIIP